jgi:hypothetical protein
MSSRRPIVCTFLLTAIAFATACGHSNGIGTCTACPEEQAIYATTNSGEVLTFPFPLGDQLGTPTSVAGPANSTGILVWGDTVYVSDPDNSAIRVYLSNSSAPGLSPASVGPFAVGATPGPMAMAGQTLYVASSAGEIFALTVNDDGSLTSLAGSPFTAGMGLSHLAVGSFTSVSNSISTSTYFLYASNSDDPNGSLSAFAINSDGSLTAVAGSPFATVPNGSPEGLNVSVQNVLYVALKNANAVAGFNINADGSLSAITGSPFAAGKGTSSLSGCGCGPNGLLFAANNLDGTISSYSIESGTGVLTQITGSPFPATMPSGDMLSVEGTLFLPDASANAIGGFNPDLSSGAISPLPDSPFPAGSGPLALAYSAFPPLDPP